RGGFMAVAIRVIPCLDVDNGRVVKGVNFENLRDAGDPVELAARYNEEGADELTFLDVSASRDGRGTMLEVVRKTAEQIFIPLTSAAASAAWRTSTSCCVPARTRSLSPPPPSPAPSCSANWPTVSAPSASCCPSTPAAPPISPPVSR